MKNKERLWKNKISCVRNQIIFDEYFKKCKSIEDWNTGEYNGFGANELANKYGLSATRIRHIRDNEIRKFRTVANVNI